MARFLLKVMPIISLIVLANPCPVVRGEALMFVIWICSDRKKAEAPLILSKLERALVRYEPEDRARITKKWMEEAFAKAFPKDRATRSAGYQR